MLKYILICILLLTTSCTQLSVKQKPIEKLPLNLDNPTYLDLNRITFTIIHKNNAESIFEKMESNNEEPLLIGLTGTNYKNLSINIEQIKNFMILQNEIIKKYKEYYEKSGD